MKLCQSALRPLSVALLCSLTACGGGGGGGGGDNGSGTTPPPATTESLTVRGDVQGLDGSTVAAYQGATRIGQATVGSDGKFNLSITYEKIRADHPVHLVATSNTYTRHALATQLDAPTTLLSKAGSDKILDLTESGLVRINEFSTARYVQLQYANQNQAFTTQASLTGKEQGVEALAMSDLALAAHMLTTGARNDARLEATGQSDTLALLVNREALAQWSRSLFVLRDGDKPLFDKHYVSARDAILLTDARALPYTFTTGNFYGDEFQYTLQANGAATLIIDHENLAPSGNARWITEGSLLRILPTINGGQSFSGYFRNHTAPVSGSLYGGQPVRDMTFIKVSELAGEPVVINAIFPLEGINVPYAASNLMHGDNLLEALSTSMLNERNWFIASPIPYVDGDYWTPDGRSADQFRLFDKLSLRSDGTGEMPELAASFRWSLADNLTLRVLFNGGLNTRQMDIRRCKRNNAPFACTQITATDVNGLTSAFRRTTAGGNGIAFSPLESPLLVQSSPSVTRPLTAGWFEFKNDGTVSLVNTHDSNRNGVLESNEILRRPAVWALREDKLVIDFYRDNNGTGNNCVPRDATCRQTPEARHLRLLARSGGDLPALLFQLDQVYMTRDVRTSPILMRPAAQPPVTL